MTVITEWSPGMRFKEGFYEGVPDVVYFSLPYWSNSGLKSYAVAPALYRWGEREATRSQALGTLWHTALLEPKQLENRYCVTDLLRAGSKAWDAEVLAAAGRELVKRKELQECEDMVAEVMADPGPLADILNHPGLKTEVVMIWRDKATGAWCKGKMDIFVAEHAIAADVKSCTDATESGFLRSVRDYRYHYQTAFYVRGCRALGLEIADFPFFAIEKRAPYLYKPWYMPGYAVEHADRQISSLLSRAVEHAEKDEWPRYDTELQTIHYPPSWLDEEQKENEST